MLTRHINKLAGPSSREKIRGVLDALGSANDVVSRGMESDPRVDNLFHGELDASGNYSALLPMSKGGIIRRGATSIKSYLQAQELADKEYKRDKAIAAGLATASGLGLLGTATLGLKGIAINPDIYKSNPKVMGGLDALGTTGIGVGTYGAYRYHQGNLEHDVNKKLEGAGVALVGGATAGYAANKILQRLGATPKARGLTAAAMVLLPTTMLGISEYVNQSNKVPGEDPVTFLGSGPSYIQEAAGNLRKLIGR